MSALKASDLASFEEDGDGNLKVTLERFGRLRIILPNTAQTIDVYVIRDKDKQFGCFVTTDVAGDEKAVAKSVKANKGATPTVTHRLLADGALFPEESPVKSTRAAATGKTAAAADQEPDADEQPAEPASDSSASSEEGEVKI